MSTNVLTNESRLLDKNLYLSTNLIQPYVTEIYSLFVLDNISNFTLSFFSSTRFLKIDDDHSS